MHHDDPWTLLQGIDIRGTVRVFTCISFALQMFQDLAALFPVFKAKHEAIPQNATEYQGICIQRHQQRTRIGIKGLSNARRLYVLAEEEARQCCLLFSLTERQSLNEQLLATTVVWGHSKLLDMIHFNWSAPYFIITGISEAPEFQVPVFLLVLILYLITLGGNASILLLVSVDSRLQKPMYYFLSNLSVLDISSATVTLHKILVAFVTGVKVVSFVECMTHVYFFMALECTELLILAVMSYDRYVAICHPLHYHKVMSRKLCAILTVFCWMSGFIEVIPHTHIISSFSCYTSNVVNHFFCDVLPLMKITCSDVSLLKLWIITEGVFVSGVIPLFMTIIPYIFIILAILKIRSNTGRQKAFYTCSSHLTVVILLYVTLYCLYLSPASEENLDSHKLFSLFNTAAVPLINPLIYSLKNKDVKSAMKRLVKPLNSKLNQHLDFYT
ncbi:olfactory receptor 8J3-like [Mantella aurantiaca]